MNRIRSGTDLLGEVGDLLKMVPETRPRSATHPRRSGRSETLNTHVIDRRETGSGAGPSMSGLQVFGFDDSRNFCGPQSLIRNFSRALTAGRR